MQLQCSKKTQSEAKLHKILTCNIVLYKYDKHFWFAIVKLGLTQAEHRNYMLHALPWL